MNRARALLIKSSRRLRRPVTEATGWWYSITTTPKVGVDIVRRRLELLLAAMYGSRFEIAELPKPVGTNVIGARRPISLARSRGETIELPATLDAPEGIAEAVARYRLLAIEQAARIARQSSVHAPDSADPLARDLYNLRECAMIDAEIVRESPGLAPVLMAERVKELAKRKTRGRLTAAEREMERLVSCLLRTDPAEPPEELRVGQSTEDSLAWARGHAASLGPSNGRYRSRPPVAIWGATIECDSDSSRNRGRPQGSMIPPSPGFGSGQSEVPFGGSDGDNQEASPAGTNAPRSGTSGGESERQDIDESPQDLHAVERAIAAADQGERSPVAGSGKLNEVDARILASSRGRDGILYPEWDCNMSAYRALGAVVRSSPAPESDGTWADRVLGEHPALVRRVRREFERLRARRVRLHRQREGDELDLDACVRALAAAAIGDSPDDRLYMAVHAARRTVAISVLVDVSGSTGDEVSDGRSVMDVEKTTLLLASEAFDALGDSYSIQTFASNGAADVRVATLKAFAEPNGELIRRRISAIEAGGNTRLGAAIRHATSIISAQPAGHRLLLILSDGKPNDVDRYFTTYAVEDSRQAVLEARSAGVYPFCLTIDANDPDPYLGRVFGTAGHTILRRPEQLPTALLDLVRELLRGGGH